MSALVAGDVAYTQQNRGSVNDAGFTVKTLKLVFGDGAKTYPAGGIPLSSLSAQGFPTIVATFNFIDQSSADGFVYKYDSVNQKLRIYQMAAHAHPLVLKNAAVADGATTRVNAGTNLLGANTGSDITVAGAGANGGVQNSTAGALAEVATSFAPAATTLYASVSGY